MIVPIIILVIVVILVLSTAYLVHQQENVIIERLGKFNRITKPGFHVRIPFIDKIAARVPLRTNREEFKIDAKTKDNVTIAMMISAQYHVSYDSGEGNVMQSGVYKAYYMLSNPISQMRDYLSDALRSSIPKYTLDEVFDKKDDIANDVNATVSTMMRTYGYEIVSTLITNIQLPKDVEDSMNAINSAQREKEAAQSLADADKIKTVVEAEAQAQAMEKSGEGIANQRIAIAEGISRSLDTIKGSGVTTKEANLLFLYTQWVEMMNEFAKSGKATTVVLPSDFEQSRSMFQQMLVANESSKDEPDGPNSLK